VGLAVLGLAALLAQLLAEHVFHAGDRAGVVVLTAVGVLGELLLIPPFGATGAAILFVAVRVIQGAVIVELARRILRERPPLGDALVPEPAVVGQGAHP
jgi:hypothetical protein